MRPLVVLLMIAACGSETPADRPIEFGGDRPAELKVPAGFDDSRQYPLLLVLHGFSLNGFAQAAYLGVSSLPSQGELFLIAPDGTLNSSGKQFWNADPACCDFENTGVDDLGYLTTLVEDIVSAWPIDRVFVVGHSNGAFMGYRLACDRAELFDSVALLAGNTTQPAASCAPSRDVRMLIMHGTADELVPYDGTAAATDVDGHSIPASAGAVGSMTRWASYDGCGTTSNSGAALDLDLAIDGSETEVQIADGCPAGTDVELWSLEGSGHVPSFSPSFAPALLDWFTAP